MSKGLMGIRKLLCPQTPTHLVFPRFFPYCSSPNFHSTSLLSLSFHTFFPIVSPILHLTPIDHETETDG